MILASTAYCFSTEPISNKIAWSLGYARRFAFGEVGFYHAGATRDTFQSWSGQDLQNTNHGYVYYPDVEFLYQTEFRPIPLEENYVGFQHGENSLAFRLHYRSNEQTLPFMTMPLIFDSTLEYTIKGTQSPVNPWAELLYRRSDTTVIAEPDLEHRVGFNISARTGIGSFQFVPAFSADFVWNPLALSDEGLGDFPNDLRYFAPSSGFELRWNLHIGLEMSIGVR